MQWKPLDPRNLIILILMTALTLLSWKVLTDPSKDDTQPTAIEIAEVNPEVKHEEKVEVVLETPKKSIRVYKASSKAHIRLPKETLDDASKYVTASSRVTASESRKVVTQVLDIRTGETEVFVTHAAQPWLALENRGQVSLDYGYKRNSSTPVGRINFHSDFLQIKEIHLGVSLSGYTDGDYFAGVGGTYRW